MRARDLAEDYPLVRLSDDALAAARLIARQRLPGVVVVDAYRHAVTVLPGSQVLRFVVPGYVQDDPSLARVYDEGAADACVSKLAGRTVHELLPHEDKPHELPKVSGEATVIECAATDLHDRTLPPHRTADADAQCRGQGPGEGVPRQSGNCRS
jgi:hypothetical protein